MGYIPQGGQESDTTEQTHTIPQTPLRLVVWVDVCFTVLYKGNIHPPMLSFKLNSKALRTSGHTF